MSRRKKKPSPEEIYEAMSEMLLREKIRRYAEKHDVSEEEAERILTGGKSKDGHHEKEGT